MQFFIARSGLLLDMGVQVGMVKQYGKNNILDNRRIVQFFIALSLNRYIYVMYVIPSIIFIPPVNNGRFIDRCNMRPLSSLSPLSYLLYDPISFYPYMILYHITLHIHT